MMSIVPPLEGDLSVGDAKQTRVGDRDAVCVAAEIGQDLSGAAERRLSILLVIRVPLLNFIIPTIRSMGEPGLSYVRNIATANAISA